MHLRGVRLFVNRALRTTVYPFNLPVFHATERIGFTAPVTFFVGENGTGKSTLLKALAQKCRIHIWRDEEGTRFDLNPFEELLYKFIEVEWTDGPVPGSYFDSQIFRDFAHYLDEWAAADPDLLRYYGGKSLVAQSHGQSLMSFFTSRYRIRGLHFLDEPETALSPASQIELLKVFRERGAAGDVQFIVASHSPILLACPGAVIYSFDRMPVSPIAYEETSHYRIYREFMADPKGFV